MFPSTVGSLLHQNSQEVFRSVRNKDLELPLFVVFLVVIIVVVVVVVVAVVVAVRVKHEHNNNCQYNRCSSSNHVYKTFRPLFPAALPLS